MLSGSMANRLGLLASFVWGVFVHSAVGLFGTSLLLISAALSQGQDRERPREEAHPGVVLDATRWVVAQLAVPFLEQPFSNALPAEEDEEARYNSPTTALWGAWVFLLAGILAAVVAALGLSVLLRAWDAVLLQPTPLPSAVRSQIQQALLRVALPYAVLAAVLLAWQAETGAFLASSTGWAQWGTDSPVRNKRRELYRGAHSAFTKAYARHQCKGLNRTEGLPSLACTANTFEAKLMQDSIHKLCKVRSTSTRQMARLKQCFTLGEELGFEREGPGAEGYSFYCRCWAASLGLVPALGSLCRLVWMGLYTGALSVLYVAAEPGTAALPPSARGEILAFGVGVAGFLGTKAMILRPLTYEL